MIRYIFHISDIHIMEKNYVNLRHSFLTLVDLIKNQGVDVSLLVIAGDIFESKSYLNTDDIHQWKSMCLILRNANIKTLIMCGNHDYNINSMLVRDNVTLLTADYHNIITVNETEIKDGSVFGDERLEFYIFSPIDKKIPKILDNGNIKIAILHEPINYARFDNGEVISGARFRASDLTSYDYVLLGDIHLHQFLADRIAYSGSFVQKNRGEGIDKGYILWDLETKSGTFHIIPLKEVYIKVIAVDNHCEVPELTSFQKARHTTLFYKNCSEKYITDLKEILIKRFKYINCIVNNSKLAVDNNVPKTNEQLNHQVSNQLDNTLGDPPSNMREYVKNDFQTHNNIIKNILEPGPNLEKILKFHSELLRNRSGVTYTTYKLNYLYFENIFCYGSDNYINFNDFNNELVLISGKNKDGKSSIIDIIIRVLFNECCRGLKEDIINKSQSKGFIKISFNIGQDEYIIEQVHNRRSKNQQHRLYKNGENITQDTIVNTYKYLRETIGLGNFSDFVNMTTALQNRTFLVDMPQKDFISLLTKITNIDGLKDLEDITKKEITLLRGLIKKDEGKLKSITDIDEATIVELKTKLDELNKKRDMLYTNINDINKELITLNRDYVDTVIPDNLEELIILNKSDREKYKKYSTEKTLTQLDNELYAISQTLASVPKDTLERIMDTKYDLKLFDKRDAILKKINSCRDTTYKPKQGTLRDAKVLQDIIENTRIYIGKTHQPLDKCEIDKLVPLDMKDRNEEILLSGLPDYKAVQNDYDNVKKSLIQYAHNYGSLHFNKTCTSCSDNEKNIRSIFNICSEQAKCDQLKHTLDNKDQYTLKYNKAKLYKHNFEQNEIFKRNQLTTESNQRITDNIKTHNDAVLELKEVENARNWDMLQKLELQEAIFKEYDIRRTEIERSQLALNKKYRESIQNYDKLTHMQTIKKKNGAASNRILELSTKERMYKKLLESTNKEILSATEEYRVKSTQFDMRKSLLDSCKENTEKLEFQKLYLQVVNCKTGIPSIILKEVAGILETKCNLILQRIADFTISIDYDTDIKIYTIENEVRISAQLGSGMQRFVLDLIFRIVLTEISCISCPQMLWVDEGFGCLDVSNFTNVANILQKLKGSFDAMFIISHISELQSYCDCSVNIVKRGPLSNVQFGNLTVGQKHLQLLAENNINNTRLTDFKDGNRAAKVKKDKSKPTEKKVKKSSADKINDTNKINAFIANNSLEKVLIKYMENGRLYCNGCKSDFVNRKGFIEKHIASSTNKKKHNEYILSLINSE